MVYNIQWTWLKETGKETCKNNNDYEKVFYLKNTFFNVCKYLVLL